MTEQEIAEWKEKIDNMSHEQMAMLWRFAPFGHPIYQIDSPLLKYFTDRFNTFGGMTPEISKRIGW